MKLNIVGTIKDQPVLTLLWPCSFIYTEIISLDWHWLFSFLYSISMIKLFEFEEATNDLLIRCNESRTPSVLLRSKSWWRWTVWGCSNQCSTRHYQTFKICVIGKKQFMGYFQSRASGASDFYNMFHSPQTSRHAMCVICDILCSDSHIDRIDI